MSEVGSNDCINCATATCGLPMRTRFVRVGPSILPTILLAADAALILLAWTIYRAAAPSSFFSSDNYSTQSHVLLLVAGFCCLLATSGRYISRGIFPTKTAQVVIGVALLALVATFEFEAFTVLWG
jgi:hypothetical protein